METIKDTKSTWKNKDKYIILGFSRCGNTSLSKYLLCAHPEIGYNGTEEYLRVYNQCTPVFIVRNPLDKLWSMYNFFSMFKGKAFEYFFDFRSPHWQGVGMNDCIEQCNYDKYIEPFKEYGVMVYRFEEIIKDKRFPKDYRGQHTPKMDNGFRDMCNDRLKAQGITY